MTKKLKIIATSNQAAQEIANALGSYGYDSEVSNEVVVTETSAMDASAILRSTQLEDRVAFGEPADDYYSHKAWIILDTNE